MVKVRGDRTCKGKSMTGVFLLFLIASSESNIAYEQFISVRGDPGIPFQIVCTNTVGIRLEFKGVSPADKVFVNRRPPKTCTASRDASKDGTIQVTFQLAANSGGMQRFIEDSASKPMKLTRKQPAQILNLSYYDPASRKGQK